MTKKEIKKIIIKNFGDQPEKDLKALTNMYYKLQGLYIELRQYPELKQGRNMWGGYPYKLEVTVFKMKNNQLEYLGNGRTKGDYAAHKGIENVGLQLIGDYYGVDYKYYLHNYQTLKDLNILVRHFSMNYVGKLNTIEFRWYDV